MTKMYSELQKTNEKIDNVHQDIKYIKHKVQDTEEDVFAIQDHLKIIK